MVRGNIRFYLRVFLKTIPDLTYNRTALVLFPDIVSVCLVVIKLEKQKVAAVELFDQSGLQTIEDQPTAPKHLKHLHKDECALMSEIGAHKPMQGILKSVKYLILNVQKILEEPVFTADPIEAAGL